MSTDPGDGGTPADIQDAHRRLTIIHLRRLAVLMISWPVSTVLLCALAWDDGTRPRLIRTIAAAGLLAVAVAGAALLAARAEEDHHGDDRPGGWYYVTNALLFLSGAAIALTPVALSSPGAPHIIYIGQVWLDSALALLVAFTTPPLRPFLALVVPTLTVNALTAAQLDPRHPGLHPLLTGGFFALLLLARHVTYRQALRALSGEIAYRRATSELTEANEQLAGANEQLHWRATHDVLTGMANRPAFLDAAHNALGASRHGNQLCAIMLIDVDRFKTINDTLGHAAGDDALRHVAGRIREVMAGTDGLAARFGGDEFAVLLTDVSDVGTARDVAQRIRDLARSPWVLGGKHVSGTVSIGVAINTDPTDEVRDLLHQADVALYQVKAAGRDDVAYFDQSCREALAQRVRDELELREAVANSEIVAWYQPVVDLETGRVVGAEALARWLHPTRGVIPTERFLPLLDESGLVPTLCNSLAVEVFRLRRSIDDRVDPGFRIGLNLGVRRHAVPSMIDQLIHQAHVQRMSPCGISLEITEHAVLDDITGTARALASARRHGFAVTLDDFGTGWSSLALLHKLELDGIKIDRTFVTGMTTHAPDAAVVTAILDLAHRLGLDVVAEGIESVDTVEHLRSSGARYGQGYLFSPAVPPEKLLALLDASLPLGADEVIDGSAAPS